MEEEAAVIPGASLADEAAHARRFNALVDGFLRGEPAFDRNIELKREHTLRVLEEARGLTAGLDPRDLPGRLEPSLVHLAALYHDLGRFEQYARWGTFRDPDSANHALLSVRALRTNDLLRDLAPENARLVMGAVFLHNRRRVPPGVAPALNTCTRLLRDADKLDIMRVLLDHFEPGAPENPVVTLGLVDEPDRYTPEMCERIEQGIPGEYGAMRYMNDFKLLLASWVFDLNCEAARAAWIERGYLRRLFSVLPEDARLSRLHERLQRCLRREPGRGEGG